MIAPNQFTALADNLFGLPDKYVEMLLALPDEDQQTAIRQTALVASDFLKYSEAVRTKTLPVLLNEKPQLKQWVPLVNSSTTNPIIARFEKFSITFVFGRRPGSMVFQSVRYNFHS